MVKQLPLGFRRVPHSSLPSGCVGHFHAFPIVEQKTVPLSQLLHAIAPLEHFQPDDRAVHVHPADAVDVDIKSDRNVQGFVGLRPKVQLHV